MNTSTKVLSGCYEDGQQNLSTPKIRVCAAHCLLCQRRNCTNIVHVKKRMSHEILTDQNNKML